MKLNRSSNIVRAALMGAVVLGSAASFSPTASAVGYVDHCGGAVAIGTIGANILERNTRNFAINGFLPTRAGDLSWWCQTDAGWVRNTVSCGDGSARDRLVYATVERRDLVRIEC